MTEQQASLAAQTAILAEQAREAAAANNGATTGVQSVLTHGGRNYEVIFFASQNSDSRPTDVLEAFAEQVAPGPRTRMAARRRREIADAVPFVEGPPEPLQGMDSNWITNEYYEDFTDNRSEEPAPRRQRPSSLPDYTAGDVLGRGDHDIAVLIRELLQPSSLNQFLQVRNAVRPREST